MDGYGVYQDLTSRGERRTANQSLGDNRRMQSRPTNAQVSGAVRRGLAKKPYSAGLGILALISLMMSVLSGGLLALDFLGYHAPGRPPHPEFFTLLLLLGLALATVGQLLGAGRNEGIRARGWVGVIDVLLIRLAFAGIVFISIVLKYALGGKEIGLYPVGVLTIVSAFFVAARLVTKFVLHIDRSACPPKS